MTSPFVHLEMLLPPALDLVMQVREMVLSILSKPVQTSARELVTAIEHKVGIKARWEAKGVVQEVELEAEAVAYLVTLRLGLQGSSSVYVFRYMPKGKVPEGVSMDLISKVAGRIEQTAKERLPRRARRDAGQRAA